MFLNNELLSRCELNTEKSGGFITSGRSKKQGLHIGIGTYLQLARSIEEALKYKGPCLLVIKENVVCG